MLKELHIENVAVIEKLDVDFGRGMLAITGETGAGKSILIDAINIVLGERASKELIRTGENSAFVSASFNQLNGAVLKVLEQYGISDDGGELQISREMSVDGRSTARINGRPVTASVLKDVGRQLVSIHGQHDSQILLLPEHHVDFVDAYAETRKELEDYQKKYNEFTELKRELGTMQGHETEKNRKAELLKYQIDEIEAAALVRGEDKRLYERREMIKNAEKIAGGIMSAYEALYEGENGSACEFVERAVSGLETSARFSDDAKKVYEALSEISYALEDAVSSVRELKQRLDFSPEEANEVEERLDIIYRLRKKYGETVDEIIDYGEKCKEELFGIIHAEERIEELKRRLETVEADMRQAAVRLSDKRKKGSQTLEKRLVEELSSMDMNGVLFKVSFTPGAYGLLGNEEIEFLISANKGEDLKPLSKIASGGELSRIMLAIKSVFSKEDTVETLIFDEIDTGVSGSAAQKIGVKMKKLASSRQVLCVTHLSQIAALADAHYKIFKRTDGKKTYTNLEVLDKNGRINELARIISGVNVTKAAIENAKEMLEQER